MRCKFEKTAAGSAYFKIGLWGIKYKYSKFRNKNIGKVNGQKHWFQFVRFCREKIFSKIYYLAM